VSSAGLIRVKENAPIDSRINRGVDFLSFGSGFVELRPARNILARSNRA
jgi:hypothetical protein